MSIRVSLSSYKIRKIFSLVDIYSIYELLHWQVYRNGLKLWFSKLVLINEGEPNR